MHHHSLVSSLVRSINPETASCRTLQKQLPLPTRKHGNSSQVEAVFRSETFGRFSGRFLEENPGILVEFTGKRNLQNFPTRIQLLSSSYFWCFPVVVLQAGCPQTKLCRLSLQNAVVCRPLLQTTFSQAFSFPQCCTSSSTYKTRSDVGPSLSQVIQILFVPNNAAINPSKSLTES